MAFVHADRCRETSSTTGTGTYSLGGAASGYRTFVAGIGTANRCTYLATESSSGGWEIGEGTVTDAATDTLSRDRIIASSNSNAAVNWSAGSRIIQSVYSAADMNPRCIVLTAGHAISSTTATEVTGLQFTSVQPGTYFLQYVIRWQTATTTVGISLGVNFTGTAANPILNLRHVTTGTTAATGAADDVANTGTGQLVEGRAQVSYSTTAPNLGPNTAGAATANANLLMVIEGSIIVTAAGDLELWHASETATSTTVMTGSMGILTRATR